MQKHPVNKKEQNFFGTFQIQKLLGTNTIATRSKDATRGAPSLTTSNKRTLLGTEATSSKGIEPHGSVPRLSSALSSLHQTVLFEPVGKPVRIRPGGPRVRDQTVLPHSSSTHSSSHAFKKGVAFGCPIRNPGKEHGQYKCK